MMNYNDASLLFTKIQDGPLNLNSPPPHKSMGEGIQLASNENNFLSQINISSQT